VGLVAGACLAGTGNTVACADVDEAKIKGLEDGILPIYEPGLQEVVRRNCEAKRLFFTTDVARAIQRANVVFIAVGTPQDEDGSADLSHVLAVAETIGDNLDEYKVVVVKSTVPVGTCDLVRTVIASRSKEDFDVVSNPEFLKEGAAVNDFLKPDRVIIGVDSDRAREIMSDIYAPFMRLRDRLIVMDIRSSEMTKYASNAMLATKISFMNEIANLCARVGADVESVRVGMSADVRIGPHFIYPGCGYGGSCFPKDVKALIGTGAQHGAEMRILESVEAVNGDQKRSLFERVLSHYEGDLSGKTIAVWGLAFKPKTDDMRDAPSEVTIRLLLEAGAKVRATDPVAMASAERVFAGMDGVELVTDAYACVEAADALLVCTEWNEYRNPDFEQIAQLMRSPVVVDGRNIYRPAKMAELGFRYYSIGRPSSEPAARV
jgi:UDPglucose 6-dehydrogenase